MGEDEITTEDVNQYKKLKKKGLAKLESKVMEEETGEQIPSKEQFKRTIVLFNIIFIIFSLFFLVYNIDILSLSYVWFNIILPLSAISAPAVLTWYFGRMDNDLIKYLHVFGVGLFWSVYNFKYQNIVITLPLGLDIQVVMLLFLMIVIGGVIGGVATNTLVKPSSFGNWKKVFLKTDDGKNVRDILDVVEATLQNSGQIYDLERIREEGEKEEFKGVYSTNSHRIILISDKNNLCFFCFERRGRYGTQEGCLPLNEKIEFIFEKILKFEDISDNSIKEKLNISVNNYMSEYFGTFDFISKISSYKGKLFEVGVFIVLIISLFGVNKLPVGYTEVKPILFGSLGGALGLVILRWVERKFGSKE